MTRATLLSRARAAWSALLGKPRTASLYKGAEVSRLTQDWTATLASPDDEMRWGLSRLRARARDLARNNPYVQRFLGLLSENVVGPTGMKLQCQVRDGTPQANLLKPLNDRIERAWAKWSENVTIGNPMSLVGLEQQAIEGVGREGESLIRIWRGFKGNPFGIALEAIDPDLLDEMLNRPSGRDGNEIRMGIEVDRYGKPVAYHVWSAPVSMLTIRTDRERMRIPADEIIHLYDPERVNQSRGMTWLAPVMYALKMDDGMDEAVLVLQRVAASKMFFLSRKLGEAGAGVAAQDGQNSLTMEANPGEGQYLPDGYEVSTFDPSLPSSEYGPFSKKILRKVAAALGISYHAMTGDLESVNYSSLREGKLMQCDTWRTLQQWWIANFRQRVYREWLRMAWLSDQVQLDNRFEFERFLDVQWVPRGWDWVDPQKDAASEVLEIQNGLTSPQRSLLERGLDPETIVRELAAWKKLLDENGVELAPKPAAADSPSPTDTTTKATNGHSGSGGSYGGGRLHVLNGGAR